MRKAAAALVLLGIGCGGTSEPAPVVAKASPEPVVTTTNVVDAGPPPPAPAPPPAAPAVVDAGPPPGLDTSSWATFTAKQGFSLKYPKDILTPKASAKGVRLSSTLFVDSPHGMTSPGQDTKHRFRIDVDLDSVALVPMAKKDLTSLAESTWPKGTLESFTKGLAEEVTIGGHPAYLFAELGAHGYNQRAVYVKLGPAKTLRVMSDIVGDYFWERDDFPAKDKVIAAKQIAIAKAVEASLEVKP